jgi:hypothetical protein
MIINKKLGVLAAMIGFGGSALAATPTLILSGRIEAVRQHDHLVIVLGKNVYTSDADRVVPGQFVNVYGVRAPDGSIRNASLESSATYSVGSDEIFVNGTVSEIDPARGIAYVDGVPVDYSQLANAAGKSPPSVGTRVQVTGGIAPASGVVSVKRAIISGGSNEAAIISGGSNQAAIISGGSNQAAIISGGSNEAAIISGGSADSQ